MQNDKWKGRKKTHEWDFMGIAEDGRQLGYCNLCEQFRWNSGKPFKMSFDEYNELIKTQKIVVDG